MIIHQRAANIRTILAVVIVAGVVAFVSLKVSESVDQSSVSGMSGAPYIHPLDNANETLMDGEPIAMP